MRGRGVTTLALQFQDIGGAIPVEITRLTALRELFLNHNRLTGPIPPELGNLTGTLPDAPQQQLPLRPDPRRAGQPGRHGEDGVVRQPADRAHPSGAGPVGELTYPRFDRNRLSGPIPAELGNLTGLVTLWMRGNMLRRESAARAGVPAQPREAVSAGQSAFRAPVPEELLDLAPSRGGKLAVFDICRSGVEGPLPQVMQRIAQGSYRGPFCDDDGHIHESSIESLAAWDAAAAGLRPF